MRTLPFFPNPEALVQTHPTSRVARLPRRRRRRWWRRGRIRSSPPAAWPAGDGFASPWLEKSPTPASGSKREARGKDRSLRWHERGRTVAKALHLLQTSERAVGMGACRLNERPEPV